MEESFNHGSSDEKLDVVVKIRELFERAEIIGLLKDFGGRSIVNYYFATKIIHDKNDKLVFFRVRETAPGSRQLYVHSVFVEDEIKEKARSQQTGGAIKSDVNARGSSLYMSILQNIYGSDINKILKITDKNQELLVVYHSIPIDDSETISKEDSYIFSSDKTKVNTRRNSKVCGVFINSSDGEVREMMSDIDHFNTDIQGNMSTKKYRCNDCLNER